MMLFLFLEKIGAKVLLEQILIHASARVGFSKCSFEIYFPWVFMEEELQPLEWKAHVKGCEQIHFKIWKNIHRKCVGLFTHVAFEYVKQKEALKQTSYRSHRAISFGLKLGHKILENRFEKLFSQLTPFCCTVRVGKASGRQWDSTPIVLCSSSPLLCAVEGRFGARERESVCVANGFIIICIH